MAQELEQILEPQPNIELDEPNISPRIAIEMEQADKADLDYIMSEIERQIREQYAQAFALESQLLAKVRTVAPQALGGGWVMNPDGSYVEDWSRVTLQDMEQFINAASSEAFFASQKVIDSYAEAVFAKYSYDDEFDDAYSRILTGTISDKTAKAKRRTQKSRWIALYKTLYYKKAKEVVDKLDAHVRRVERIYSEKQKENERSFRASWRG